MSEVLAQLEKKGVSDEPIVFTLTTWGDQRAASSNIYNLSNIKPNWKSLKITISGMTTACSLNLYDANNTRLYSTGSNGTYNFSRSSNNVEKINVQSAYSTTIYTTVELS